jgi:purine-binding chemotaxis protein CheW
MSEQTKESKSYLSFRLGSEQFGIEVVKIIEILEVPRITKVPHAPSFMKGVVNLRGGVLPVIDTRVKFGMSAIEQTIETCIIVLNIELQEERLTVGAMVDAVSEVFELESADIQPSPAIGSKYKPEFIMGMMRFKDQFLMLLNIDKVFSAGEAEVISEFRQEVA